MRRIAGLVADYTYVGRSRLRYWRYGSRPPVPLDAGPDAPPPVLLLPGVFETWHYMKPIRDRLVGLGIPVHSVPALGFNRHPIPVMAERAAAYLVEHDLHGVRIIAHSKGGLIGKSLLVADDPAAGGAGRFERMLSINTPYGGSPLARFGVGPFREFQPTRPVIQELASSPQVNARITALRSAYDQYVPTESAELAGAQNVPMPHIGHFRVLGLREVIDRVVAWLG
ncbi:MAG: alpha/beta hydrolase [Yonghaparkia sp.]|nr:alpha/beta hydrolase [Microcella sp.]